MNPGQAPDWSAQRQRMIDQQLRRRGIHDERVLAAMLELPREKFIPAEHRAHSYSDDPVPIGHGQTISQPYMTALMAQSLRLKESDKVLEVGCGSGYHAAVLGALAARVIAIEIIPELAAQARRNLEAAGCGGNIVVVCGDGSAGYPGEAPFDAISVAAAAPDVPPRLLEQLRDPGRMVIPVGSLWDQELRVITKIGGVVRSDVPTYCRFVPLRGGDGWE